ncbi:hypothetical protein [Arthrobacter ramosus]|uniref:DUF11 domain-containing protein n=1 Tax=Arthrobacter ramosus TaxID=1672 RepID=A0ABV5XY62_ARTRM|nr:hypothetical protein [Arthrobacter ramosus]
MTRRRPLRSAPLARKKHVGNIVLVYGADKSAAGPGETIIFTAWIINDSKVLLRNVCLIPGSFTNEGMESLDYTSKPHDWDLDIGTLSSGESAMLSFSYVVSASDHRHGGELVSAMGVAGMSRGRVIRDEHDAIVALKQ